METNRFAMCVAALALLAGHAAYGQETEKAEPGPFDLRLTGDWGGLRSDWADSGITVEPNLKLHFQRNLDGGLGKGEDFFGSLDLDITLDLDRMGVADGATFFIRGVSTWSDGVDSLVGGLYSVHEDAEGNHEALVEQWWWRQDLGGGAELFLGRLDTDGGPFIDSSAYAGDEDSQFTNIALTQTMTVPHTTGLGAMLRLRPTERTWVSLAVVDADSRPRRTGFDTAFHGRASFRGFLEAGLTTNLKSANGPLPGNYRAGMWYDGGSRAILDRPWRTDRGDVGFYLGFDQMVWKENGDPGDTQGLGVFGRYGYAPDDTSTVEHFWSAGLQYQGLFEGRDNDVLGLGIAQGILSDKYSVLMSPMADRETSYELYYSWQVTPSISISPNMQYISHPGGREDIDDALVVGVRAKISF